MEMNGVSIWGYVIGKRRHLLRNTHKKTSNYIFDENGNSLTRVSGDSGHLLTIDLNSLFQCILAIRSLPKEKNV